MRPIVLSVKRNTWRMHDDSAEPSDAEFKKEREKCLQRDDYTCQFCGWRSLKYQDVHHANDCHADNSLENLVTACKLCHGCHHLGFAGQGGAGAIILLEEIDQVDLNRIVRMCAVVAAIGSPEQKAFVGKLWKFLMSRAAPVKATWGSASPTMFANKLMSLPDGIYERRGTSFMAPLRFLISPSSVMVKDAVPTWVTQFGRLPTDVWESVANEVLVRIANVNDDITKNLTGESEDLAELMAQSR